MVGYNPEPINGRELSSAEYSEAGLASGIATRMIIQPLDVLKIRFQLQEEPIRGQNSGKYKGVLQSVRLITREEGVRSFWKGHVPAQGLSAMYGLVQFSSFEFLSREAVIDCLYAIKICAEYGSKPFPCYRVGCDANAWIGCRLPPNNASLRSSADFFCGGLSGCLAMTAAMPLDVIRTRLVAQSGNAVYRGTTHAIIQIWHRDGPIGYFRGWIPSIAQIAPFTGLQFALYNCFIGWWPRIVPNHESTGALLSGAMAGTVAKTVLYPLDMVRHRLQMNGFERRGFGQLVSAQALCFTLSKLVFGVASDRFSSLRIISVGLVVSAVTSIYFGFVSSFYQILLSVVCIGCFQGASWVPATKLVGKWYTDRSYAKMFSILGCGSTVAGLLIPFVEFSYWRTLLLYLGLFSFGFAAFLYYTLRRDDTNPPRVEAKDDSASLLSVTYSPAVWSVAAVYLFSMEVRTVCETWIPLYINEKKISLSTFQVAYEVGGIGGNLLSGLLLDQLCLHMSTDSARRLVGVASSALLLLVAAISIEAIQYVFVVGCLLGFLVNASINIWCMIASQMGESHISGAISAFVSFLANFGSVMAGSPLALLIDNFGYSCFVPFFLSHIAVLITITLMNVGFRVKGSKQD